MVRTVLESQVEMMNMMPYNNIITNIYNNNVLMLQSTNKEDEYISIFIINLLYSLGKLKFQITY